MAKITWLTAGNIKDIAVAAHLIESAGPIRQLLADMASNGNHLRRLLDERGIEAVIASTASRKRPIGYDTVACKHCNRIERLWCRLKDWRRLATRPHGELVDPRHAMSLVRSRAGYG